LRHFTLQRDIHALCDSITTKQSITMRTKFITIAWQHSEKARNMDNHP
jgi:hypothetical protein